MLRKLIIYSLPFFLNPTIASAQDTVLNLVPMPVSISLLKGDFVIKPNAVITCFKEVESEAKYLQQQIKDLHHLSLAVMINSNQSKPERSLINKINLSLSDSVTKEEGYNLKIDTKQVRLTARDAAGIFYGIQTLLQLLKPATKTTLLQLPCITVDDYPRFSYRGMHLDVSRHFFPVDYIKKYLDFLAAHKLNTFHWQFSDDQGWRMEVKKYPTLTAVGSCRERTLIGRFGSRTYDSIRYCGFYTQAQVKEVISYASARHIMIIPEIDMPGHAMSALASYPYLGCTGGPYKVLDTWGSVEESMCPGKEGTYEFIDGVIGEMAGIFPSAYIHMGGDETSKVRWMSCADCRKRMNDEGLKSFDELHNYFVQRVEKIINAHGKQLMGWDEILESKLNKETVVMNWRGEKRGIAAVKKGLQVIMTPESYVYLDYSQTRNEDSITIGNYLPVEKVYSWDPVPAGFDSTDASLVLGAQANVFTEYITNPGKLEYMIFPRMSALSEVFWSPLQNKNWASFEKRIPGLFHRYNLWGVRYSMAIYDMQPSTAPTEDLNGIYWQLKTRGSNNIIIYDSVKKLSAFGKAEAKIRVDHEGLFKAIMYEDKTDGKTLSKTSQYFVFNKATGKRIDLTFPPNQKYSNGGAFTLVNGIVTTRGMNQSQHFLGFLGTDLEALIDMNATTAVKSITLNVFEQTESWIYLPSEVEFSLLDENKNVIDRVSKKIVPDAKTRQRKITVELAGNARYVKVVAKNYGTIPLDKPGGGTKAWLFADEIEIN